MSTNTGYSRNHTYSNNYGLAANEAKERQRGSLNASGKVTASATTHPPGYAAKMKALYNQLVAKRYNTGRRNMNVQHNMNINNNNNNSTGGASKNNNKTKKKNNKKNNKNTKGGNRKKRRRKTKRRRKIKQRRKTRKRTQRKRR